MMASPHPAIVLLALTMLLLFNYHTTPKPPPQQPELKPQPQLHGQTPGWHKGHRMSQCEDYTTYSTKKHKPLSKGELKLPFMRPPDECKTFKSAAVEELITDYGERMIDDDLFQLFRNCLPNTLDTTILWHNNDIESPRTFVSTGDIHAEWLRDSARQLSVYQRFIKQDESLKLLIKGAILQQAEYINVAPYCNAFQPPKGSNVPRKPSSVDKVSPKPDWEQVFECKWELDSLASFLTLINEYLQHSGDYQILRDNLVTNSFHTIAKILKRESTPTFRTDNGKLNPFHYAFRRDTDIGSETLVLSGLGNPLNGETGLVRSAFRPSDDACIFQYLIPANIQMMVELRKLTRSLREHNDIPIMPGSDRTLSWAFQHYADEIQRGVEEYAIVEHPQFGKVYAYEVDGYGGRNIMDDANLPSLLSLPVLEYTTIDDPVYANTRRMVLSKRGNPYYLVGNHLQGIGGPHVGLFHVWPMSIIMQIRTTDDDNEILALLDTLKRSSGGLGLMHEGVHVSSPGGAVFTRSWFSWCNSEFGKMVLELAERKPWLLFKDSPK